MEEHAVTKPRPSEPRPGAFIDRPAYKWWVTWTIMVGSFLFALDTTIVNIAIPKIMTSISADLNQIQWVLIIYMIGMAVVMPAAGWLSDLCGHKWLYTGSLAVFTLSSALCGMAWSPASLICFRLLQGFGAGAIAPTAMAVIYRVFPPQQRGLAMGIYSLGWTFGPILGPTLGGYLTDTLSWRAIFYINLPIGIVGVGLAATIMGPDLSHRRVRGNDVLDLPRPDLIAAGLDEVGFTVDQEQIPVGISIAYVTRIQPWAPHIAGPQRLGRCLRLLPIRCHDLGRSEDDLPDFPWGQGARPAVQIHNVNLDIRQGEPHRAHFLLATHRMTDTGQHGFGQGIAFDNASPCQGLEALFGLRRQRRRPRETTFDGL